MVLFDQMGREIVLPNTPKRIISLVPSQTELLYDLGVEPIGQTIFCVHPANRFKHAVKIGGTKKLNIEKIRSLNPDLIIGNKEENLKSEIDELSKHFPVWMSDVKDLKGNAEMMTSLGDILKKEKETSVILSKIENAFARCKEHHKRAAYLIWKDPLMAVGSDTFINSIMKQIGIINVFQGLGRYPEVTFDMLQVNEIEVLLLSTEPFPFNDNHIAQFQKLLPDLEIQLVDGEMFSWYGSRLQYAPKYFNSLAF